MRAYVIDDYRGPLVMRDLPDPQPATGEVLVAIHATSVNPFDLKLREGAFKALMPVRMPLVLGCDLAGTVIAVGEGVTRFVPGDAVFARASRIGTFAEQIVVSEGDLAHKPESLDMIEAASLPLVALTAWQVLVERAKVKPGQKVLIHAGSGGVGTIAVQLAKHLGATVAATCGTDNVELVRSLGADVVIDYRNEDFEDRLSGYDMVLNTQGTEVLRRSVSVLRRGGTLVSLSGPPDPAFARQAGVNWLIRQAIRLASARLRWKARRNGVAYSFLFMHADGGQLSEIARLVDDGTIRPVIDRVEPFDRLAKAVERVATGRSRGKVVVRVGEDA